MSVLKRFLALICAAGLLISGCGSDKSKSEPPPPAPKQEATQQVESPPPVPKSTVKLYGDDLAITQDQFVNAYNSALDQLASQDGKNYNDRKITFDNPKNVEQTKKGGVNFYSGKYCSVSVHRNSPSASNICGVSLMTMAGVKVADMLPEITSATFAATLAPGDYSEVAAVVGNLLKVGRTNAVTVDGLIIYYDSNGLMIFAEDATIDDGFGKRIVDNLKSRAR